MLFLTHLVLERTHRRHSKQLSVLILFHYISTSHTKCTYLVFAEEWQVKDDLKRLSVSCENHKVGQTLVQGFCGFIRSLLQLYHLTTRLATAFRERMQNHVPSIVSLEKKSSVKH